MTFRVEITPVAEGEIETAYRWYQEQNSEFADRWFHQLMNAIASLQEQPRRCALAFENNVFAEEMRQLLYGKTRQMYRILFTIRADTVYILYVRHIAQAPITEANLES